MYSIFVSVLLLFQFNLAVAQDLASDKESLKKSLVHVDHFLQKVGQRIDTERNYLQSVGRRNANTPTTPTVRDNPVTVDGVSNEDYAKLWFGGNKFHDNPNTLKNRKKDSDTHVGKGQKGFSNFLKAVATLDDEELKKGTTMKLVNAVQDLKGLVESEVDVKNNKNATKLETLRKIQEALRKNFKGNKVDVKKSKRDNDYNSGEFDVFGGMDFPEDSNLPKGITTKEVPFAGGGGSPPEVLDERFIIKSGEMRGPGPEVMVTPSTTTDDNELLLNPDRFGYTTTHRPLPTYGDLQAPPAIDKTYFKTTPAPDSFVAGLQADMEKFHMGVFSIAMLKIFHMIIWKNQADARRVVDGLRRSIQELDAWQRFNEFGQPTKDAVRKVINNLESMPYDEMRSELVLLHNALLHRRELFSADVNSLVDHIDALYTKQEARQLLQSLEPLDDYSDGKDMPKTISDKILDNFLSPWRRIKGTVRGNILKEALNRAIKNHFYVNDPQYADTRRTIINIPVEFIPSFKAATSVTPARPQPNFRSGNIEVYAIDTRRDDINKNIYNTDFQTIYNNFMRNKNIEASKPRVNKNAKPLFNKQLKSTLNIVNKDVYKSVNKYYRNEKPNPLRINLNAKVTGKPASNRIMIITNNNQAKSNIVKPRAIFRSGDSYVDFNVMMNDSLVDGAEQFQLEMYPDVPMLVDQPPNELNFQIDGDKVNLQVDGDKKVIVINKKNDVPMDTFREDIDLKMTSSSSRLRKKKHHKKHHKKHKRTHKHSYLKEKLARIKEIVKRYRSGHKKHRRHHKHEKHKSKSLSIKDTLPPSPITRKVLNATKSKPASDRRFQIQDSLSTTRSPLATHIQLDFTTQVYAVRSNFINSLRRQMMDVNKVNLAIEENVQSDEEIALRRNLYKAMSVGRGGARGRDARRANRKRFLRGFFRDSMETDEEAQLKENIYSYFNNIQPE